MKVSYLKNFNNFTLADDRLVLGKNYYFLYFYLFVIDFNLNPSLQTAEGLVIDRHKNCHLFADSKWNFLRVLDKLGFYLF